MQHGVRGVRRARPRLREDTLPLHIVRRERKRDRESSDLGGIPKPRLDLRVRVRARGSGACPASPVPVERERESSEISRETST